MTFRQFAFNNVLRNKRTYAAYFLSSAFSVMVFFIYAVFAFHPGLGDDSINKNIKFGMHFAESLIYVFSFFFVLYSMSAFLKTRKKEFGLMVMLGMTNTQLRTMIFLENIMIGFFATLAGIGMGLIFSKLMLLIAERFMHLDTALPFYMPFKALALTFLAFVVLFVFISLFTVTILRTNKLIDLIKGSAKPKTEPKFSALLSWLAVLLLSCGYAVALIVKGIFVVYAMVPVTIVVIIGTYFLFTQLSVFLIHKFRSKRSFFWRKTNMLFLSDLAYRMKDNARTFFMVAILSTVAFSAIGSLVGFRAMMIKTVKSENPYAFEYIDYSGSNEHAADDLALIERELQADHIQYNRLQATMSRVKAVNTQIDAMIVKQSEFNPIAVAAGEQPVALKEGQSMMIYYENSLKFNAAAGALKKVQLAVSGITLDPIGRQPSVAIPNFSSYYVVTDTMFDKLVPGKKDVFYAFEVQTSLYDTRDAGERLSKQLKGKNNGFKALAYDLFEIEKGYSVVLFIGFFIGAVFFVASGSFLYFRLYSDLPDDQTKFSAITKLGLTGGELSGIVTKQLFILFFVPIIVATVHGAVALTAMQHLFGHSLMKEAFMVLGTFVLIQLVYFLLIRSRYVKQVAM
ncbi:ABC transporter permease [Cohnella soli]|uniref:ABC transporter permease n=1 Tax=Cohnella soli TaxID=425005 RepID=A0ABW0I1L1_9BACL